MTSSVCMHPTFKKNMQNINKMLSLVLHAEMKEVSYMCAVKMHNPRQRSINPFCNDRYLYTFVPRMNYSFLHIHLNLFHYLVKGM